MTGIKVTAIEKTENCFKKACQTFGTPSDNDSSLSASNLERSTLNVNRSRRADAVGILRCDRRLHHVQHFSLSSTYVQQKLPREDLIGAGLLLALGCLCSLRSTSATIGIGELLLTYQCGTCCVRGLAHLTSPGKLYMHTVYSGRTIDNVFLVLQF
jgi:hypothetical protein